MRWSNEAFKAGKEIEKMKRLTLHRIASSLLLPSFACDLLICLFSLMRVTLQNRIHMDWKLFFYGPIPHIRIDQVKEAMINATFKKIANATIGLSLKDKFLQKLWNILKLIRNCEEKSHIFKNTFSVNICNWFQQIFTFVIQSL